jgi:hypothetical protein
MPSHASLSPDPFSILKLLCQGRATGENFPNPNPTTTTAWASKGRDGLAGGKAVGGVGGDLEKDSKSSPPRRPKLHTKQ